MDLCEQIDVSDFLYIKDYITPKDPSANIHYFWVGN